MTEMVKIAERLATIEADLDHTKRAVDRIEKSELEAQKVDRELRDRVLRLEGQEARLEGIPAQVNKNDKNNAVQEAMREGRDHIVRETRRTVAVVVGVPSAVLALAALLSLWNGGGP